MKVSPWILGACALVPVAGAVAGMSLNTTPLAPERVSSIPSGSPVTAADAAPQTRARLPDHYAMETPEGRVEVHELAMRGREADRWRAAQAREARYEADLAAMESRWAEQEVESRAAAALAPAPLDLGEPARVTVEPQMVLVEESHKVATSRSINVSLALELD